jgi:hypothetical protein
MARTLSLVVRNVMFTIVVRTVPRWIPRRPRHS